MILLAEQRQCLDEGRDQGVFRAEVKFRVSGRLTRRAACTAYANRLRFARRRCLASMFSYGQVAELRRTARACAHISTARKPRGWRGVVTVVGWEQNEQLSDRDSL